MSGDQFSLFDTPAPAPAGPEGLRYRTDLLNTDEERALIGELQSLAFKPFEFQGFLGKRRVVSFGWRYDFNDRGMAPAEPLPDYLEPLRDRAAAFAELEPASLEHVLVTEYAPGAPIGWHRDRPEFDKVVGVSLGSPCTFRMRRKQGAKWERYSFTAQPRSVYLLDGPARREWEHSIPEVEALRYSITFRTLRR